MLTFGEQISAAIAAPALFIAVISTLLAVSLAIYDGLFLWRGLLVEGTIVRKLEWRDRGRPRYTIVYRFAPKKRPYQPFPEVEHSLMVSPEQFAQFSEDQTVSVRYVRGQPHLARLADLPHSYALVIGLVALALVFDVICVVIWVSYL
jgi:hypothetical protein